MAKNISSKITYAARLISKNDKSAGGYHYSGLDTVIYLLQFCESKHVGAEINNLNLLLKVSHIEYGTEKPVYIYYGPEKSDSMNESILNILKKEVFSENNEENFEKIPLFFENLKDLLTIYDKHVHLDKGKEESSQYYYYSDPPVAFLERLDSLSKTTEVVNFVDGIEESNNSDSANELNLYSAQLLNDKVRDKSNLEDNDLYLINTLLTKAPLNFGYWGAFKSVIKFFDPALSPVEFGKGLGRLCQKSGSDSSFSEIDYEAQGYLESLSWIKEVIPNSPSIRTIDYMQRRMRRELKKIGDENPDLYALIASNMLIKWDSLLNKKSYLPAYVLAGSKPHLDRNQGSRIVYLPLIQKSRLDPHQEAWDSNLQMVNNIFNSIEKSSETLLFAYFILKDNKQKIPELTVKNVLLALSSQIDELASASYKLLPKYIEERFSDLSVFQWQSFFEKSEEESFNSLINKLIELKAEEKIEDMQYGLSNYLATYIEEADLSEDIERAGPLSNLYLNFLPRYRWNTEVLDKKLIKAISIFYSLSSEDIYFEKLIGKINIRFDDLIEIYFEIESYPKLPSENLKIFKEILLNNCLFSEQIYIVEGIKKCFCSLSNDSEEIGWRILNKFQNNEDFYEKGRIIALMILLWLKDEKESNLFEDKWHSRRIDLIKELFDKYPDLAEEKMSNILTDNTWAFTSSDKLYLLSKSSNPMTPRIVWDSLANENSDELKDLVLMDKSFLKILGDQTNIEDLTKIGNIQQAVLNKYIEDNPYRVKNDLSFGLAIAAVPNPTLQDTVISQLVKINALQSKWLLLAEIGLPKPILAARKFIESLSDKKELSDCILASIDSSVIAVRDMGLQLLDKNSDRINKDKLIASLSTSDDQKVQARVAEELLIKNNDDSVFEDFDNRVLITRRRNRKAKEKIKVRLDSDSRIKNQGILAPKRIEALLNLAKGKNIRDREWALNRIASLSLKGVRFDGIDFSKTNTRGY